MSTDRAAAAKAREARTASTGLSVQEYQQLQTLQRKFQLNRAEVIRLALRRLAEGALRDVPR